MHFLNLNLYRAGAINATAYGISLLAFRGCTMWPVAAGTSSSSITCPVGDRVLQRQQGPRNCGCSRELSGGEHLLARLSWICMLPASDADSHQQLTRSQVFRIEGGETLKMVSVALHPVFCVVSSAQLAPVFQTYIQLAADCLHLQVRSLTAFRLTGGTKDYLAVGTDSGKITVLEFSKEVAQTAVADSYASRMSLNVLLPLAHRPMSCRWYTAKHSANLGAGA